MRKILLATTFAVATMALGFSAPGHAQGRPASTVPKINFCTASATGNYFYAAQQIAGQLRGVADVNVIETKGSLDNFSLLKDKTCDVAIVQSDAYGVYMKNNPQGAFAFDVGAELYPELLHLICNKSVDLGKITGLTKDTAVLVGENGGGTAVTWESFKLADPKRYGPVQSYPLGDVRALNKVLLGGPVSPDGPNVACMLQVSGLKSPAMMKLNEAAHNAKGKIGLVAANDRDVLRLRPPGNKNGAYVYKDATIPSDTYPDGLQPHTLISSNSVDTVSVEALLIASNEFIDGRGDLYNKLLSAVNAAMPAIKRRVEPR